MIIPDAYERRRSSIILIRVLLELAKYWKNYCAKFVPRYNINEVDQGCVILFLALASIASY